MESSTYPDKKVIEMSRNFVNVVAHSETGHEKEVIFGGKKVSWCSRYWGIACEAHSKCYQEARSKYDGISGVPCTVFADPSGKELFREAGGMAGSELVKKMQEALTKVPGEKVHYDLWAGTRKNLADGDASFEKGEYKKAIEAWNKVVKMKQKAIKELGEAALKRAEDKGSEMLEDARSKVESDKEEAKKILKTLSEQFKPLEVSKKALDLLKTLQ